MKTRMFLLSLAAAASPVAAFAQVAAVTPVPVIQGTRLDIVAEGEVTRTPDIATISAGVVTQAATAGAAMAENAQRMATTVAALRKAGVADRDIQTSAINLNPQYRYGENVPPVITGYQASNQVSVRFRDVKRAGAILDTLVSQGANQISGPNFSVDKPEAALDEARTAAIAKARARAELYAKAAGLSVRRILSISESGEGAQPPRPMPMMAAMARNKEAADTSIEAGEQKLSVSVSVTFELQFSLPALAQRTRPRRTRLTIASRITAPRNDTSSERISSAPDVIEAPPSSGPRRKPPSNAPTMPTTTFSTMPCCASVRMTMLASQPRMPPTISVMIRPISIPPVAPDPADARIVARGRCMAVDTHRQRNRS